jgi:hypothetical protein
MKMCKEHLSTQPFFKDSPFATYLTAGMIAEATWYRFDDLFYLHKIDCLMMNNVLYVVLFLPIICLRW